MEANPTSSQEDTGSIPGQWDQGSAVTVSCGVRRRHGSDHKLLWLWGRLAAAALIQPLAWELRAGAALKRKKKKKEKEKKLCHSYKK